MRNKNISKNCKHDGVLIKIGCWNAIEAKTRKPVGGTIAVCKICGNKLNITWEEWKELEKNPCLIQQSLINLN